MRVIAKRTLREFWKSKRQFSEAHDPLSAWHTVCLKAQWQGPNDVKENFGSASFFGKNVVFNIASNNYRLVARISYSRQAILIKFVGVHKQYDAIDVEAL